MFNKIFKKDKITVQKYQPFFTTVDNATHEGLRYNWVIADRIRCSVPEYIMISIREDGYIEDNNRIMYPLYNVVSIEWKLVKEMVVEDNFNEFQVFVSDIKEDF